MPPRKLPRHLTWLESFVASVEIGSLEGAARHLEVARSVVSEHLKALEGAVADGRPLLERGAGRRLRLTPTGGRLYEAVHAPLHQLDLRRLRDLASPEPSLRLGLNPTLSTLVLPALAQELARRGLRVEASFGGAYELVRQVQTGQLDLALGFTPLPPHRGVAARSLALLPFVVLASPRCRLPSRRPLRVADLEGAPFVDWLRDDPYGGANSARFIAAGVGVREVARAESFLHLFDLLRAYKACAITPDLRPLAPFPLDLSIAALAEPEPQAVEVVALWAEQGARTEVSDWVAFLAERVHAEAAPSEDDARPGRGRSS
ncbi:MAG: LysR family transcriptional regulator [Polyangiaceae bacterium]|jgi:DNA-binding transcriptional LysR family regulator|nr:LysR family transcriptional regulator [Polyangiaceae bacterium]